eukprot:1043016-Alexandrium_andersonii.AAC.1
MLRFGARTLVRCAARCLQAAHKLYAVLTDRSAAAVLDALHSCAHAVVPCKSVRACVRARARARARGRAQARARARVLARARVCAHARVRVRVRVCARECVR